MAAGRKVPYFDMRLGRVRPRFFLRQVKWIMYATLTPTRSGGHKQASPVVRWSLEPEDTQKTMGSSQRQRNKRSMYARPAVHGISTANVSGRRAVVRWVQAGPGGEVICMTALFFPQDTQRSETERTLAETKEKTRNTRAQQSRAGR